MRTCVIALLLVAFAANAKEFVVTTSADAGVGSLRWAIEQANSTPGRDRIRAACAGGCVIAVESALPAISDPVVIWGRFEIDGGSAGPADGLIVEADDTSVDYVSIARFTGDGFVIRGDRASLSDVTSSFNRNGLRLEGSNGWIVQSTLDSNREAGVWITSAASAITIETYDCVVFFCGPNEIHGNDGDGIRVDGSRNRISGTEIGIWGANGGNGITVRGTENVVKGNAIRDGGGSGLYLETPAYSGDNLGHCNLESFIGGPAAVSPPQVTSARADAAMLAVYGVYRGIPDTSYQVEAYEEQDCANWWWKGRLGRNTFRTDAFGQGRWRVLSRNTDVSNVRAIVTGVDVPETSRVSKAVVPEVTGERNADLVIQTTGPAAGAPGQEIELVTTITNNGPAAIRGRSVFVPVPDGAEHLAVTIADRPCSQYPSRWHCGTDALDLGDAVTVRHRIRLPAREGTVTYSANLLPFADGVMIDPAASNDAATHDVFVTTAIPALSPIALLLLTVVVAALGVTVTQSAR